MQIIRDRKLVAKLLALLQVDIRGLAAILGTTQSTIARWRAGGIPAGASPASVILFDLLVAADGKILALARRSALFGGLRYFLTELTAAGRELTTTPSGAPRGTPARRRARSPSPTAS